MEEQLSLFGDENTLFNVAVGQLLEMNFDGCLKTLDHYRRMFPWGRNVNREMELAGFWKERIRDVDWSMIDLPGAGRLYKVWTEFEETFDYPWRPKSLEEQFQVKFFSKVINGLGVTRPDKARKLPNEVPIGLLYLIAGRVDEAIQSLQSLIATEPGNATAYGYLGDAYVLRRDLRTARICYREAFVIAADRVDLKRIQDRELREKLNEVLEDENAIDNPLGWFPVTAQLDGFFEQRILRDLEELKQWLQQYFMLAKNYHKNGDRGLVPRLFYHAMVLSDNASIMRFIKKVELPELRRNMKEWNPKLFKKYMSWLENKHSR
ncbi:MAG: hypothetical protein JRJ69_00285 [Deltaproteobacteria bacterium]|nr:hypothetical protein [Deltaproteobacteria bacterium]